MTYEKKLNKIPKMQKYKIQLHGEYGVGKTSLMYSFSKGQLPNIHGYFDEWVVKNASFATSFGKRKVLLEIHDFIPVERFSRFAQIPYKSAHVHLLLVDMTDKTALEKIAEILEKIKKLNEKDSEPLVYIVVTKSDLEWNYQITEAQVQQFARENSLSGYAITSAKTGDGLNEFFSKIAETIYKKHNPIYAKLDQGGNAPEASLIRNLTAYINRIELNKNSGKIDFSSEFCFFAASRAINREANYLLAKKLLEQLQQGYEISNVFQDVEGIRRQIIIDYKLYDRPDYAERGCNSSELNEIIAQASSYKKESVNNFVL
jgi:GTPase SAR1 family protein